MLPKKMKREIVYESKWVNLYLDEVHYPDGSVIAKHHLLHFNNPSVGVVISNAQNEILLIKTARYTTQKILWEIPAGFVDEGEDIYEAIKREAEEETGYIINEVELLVKEYPLDGISDKIDYLFKARIEGSGIQSTPEEIISMQWFSEEEIRKLIKNSELQCGMSMLAIMLFVSGF